MNPSKLIYIAKFFFNPFKDRNNSMSSGGLNISLQFIIYNFYYEKKLIWKFSLCACFLSLGYSSAAH